MRHLDKPTDDAKTVFLTCISAIGDTDLKNRLSNCADAVAMEADTYNKNALINKLHTLSTNKQTKANKSVRIFLGQVTIKEMKSVYTNFFVPEDSLGRELYDRILALPKNGRCPYCFHRVVSTIDHYLPKAYYPLLSVVPINLVPCCKDCNMGLLGQHATKASEEILHPYYDNVEDELWLKAAVNQTSPVSLNFFVDCPSHWTDILIERVKFHFQTLDLNLLYSLEAGNELNNIRYLLQEQYKIGGAEGVKDYLTQQAISRKKNHTNSWQTAMYSAVSKDDWFCKVGFEL